MNGVTLAEVKVFLQILTADTTHDALITALIPEVEADYIVIRNRPFFRFTGDLTSGSAIIENVKYYDGIEYASRVYHASIDGSVIDIDSEDQTITLSTNATATVDDAELMIYPAGIKIVLAEMIGYLLEKKYGVQSYSLGDFSASMENQLINGYPKSIVGRIKRFVNIT